VEARNRSFTHRAQVLELGHLQGPAIRSKRRVNVADEERARQLQQGGRGGLIKKGRLSSSHRREVRTPATRSDGELRD